MDLIGARVDVAVESWADCTSATAGSKKKNRLETRPYLADSAGVSTRHRMT
jgi:hypothetical protein